MSVDGRDKITVAHAYVRYLHDRSGSVLSSATGQLIVDIRRYHGWDVEHSDYTLLVDDGNEQFWAQNVPGTLAIYYTDASPVLRLLAKAMQRGGYRDGNDDWEATTI